MKIIKSLLLLTSLNSMYAISADDSYWDGYAKIYPNAFNISQVEFTNGHTIEHPGPGSVAIWGWGEYQDATAFLNYYQLYMDELEYDILYKELLEIRDVACPMNADRTDNKAYRVVAYSDLIFKRPDLKVLSFSHGDVVGGSDWDNNGKIDVLENIPSIKQSATCDLKLR